MKYKVSMLEKFEIACLTGTSTISYLNINDEKDIAQLSDINKVIPFPHRILELVNDKQHGFGMILLSDNGN